MTPEEIEKHYGNKLKATQALGIAYTNFYNWRRMGFIPWLSQVKYELETKGKLVARLKDAEPHFKQFIKHRKRKKMTELV